MNFRNLAFSYLPSETPEKPRYEKHVKGLLSFIASLQNQRDSQSNGGSFSPSQKKQNISKGVRFAALVLVSIGVLFAGSKILSSMKFGTNAGSGASVKGAIATNELNKEFSFPLKNAKGDEIGALKYLIEKVELRDEIIVKGQRATAVEGRQFVILTIKISNEFKQSIQINTRDYVRLAVNGNEQELLAPDIHNDPVEVQAISTKYTRLGFPINTTDKNITLFVGEINNDQKERIELTF
jgi:hypothetical protein